MQFRDANDDPASDTTMMLPDSRAGVPDFPLVTISTATCCSLTLSNGASVIVQPGSGITVSAKNP